MYCEGAMRRWPPLYRSQREPDQRAWDRCVLFVEELETRAVPAGITVFAPSSSPPPQTPENVSLTFSGSASPNSGAFYALDPANGGQTYDADITSTHGTVTIDPSQAMSVTVTNNGTADVKLVGPLDNINNILAAGVTLIPTAYYSGDSVVTVSVADMSAPSRTGAGSVDLHVTPVASDPSFTVAASGEVWAPSSGLVFPPGFVSVAPWPDLDGSETVTVTFSLNDPNADQFTLSAGGTALTPVEPGFWQITCTDPAALQALLNSLVLTPPTGYTGRTDIFIEGDLLDQAAYADGSGLSDSAFLGFSDVQLRFFLGGSVTAPQVLGREGGTIDLGGRFVASDPDELPGDVHTLALAVPSGTLTLNSGLVPSGLSATDTTAADGSTTILLTGTIDQINQFLAAPGDMTYTAASPFFSGAVPLSLTLTNFPGSAPPMGEGLPDPSQSQSQSPLSMAAPGQFTATAQLAFVPVAEHAHPSASDATTPENTPVAVSISVPALTDTSDSLLIVVSGVPTGASFNHGTDLGNGQWALAQADLTGLVFTPPTGATGTFTLTVSTVVTDSAPALGLTDTATDSATFNVTVTPLPAPAPTPVSPPVGPQLPPAAPPVVPVLPVSPPVIQLLPPATTTAIVGTASVPVATAIAAPGTSSDSSSASTAATPINAAFVNAYASGVTSTVPSSVTETRVSLMPPAPGTLFVPVEVPLPTYGGGERHPLPPVLPLDQTLPVAAFSESGGDSFALIDKLYRDAAGDRVSANVPSGPSPARPDSPAAAVVAVKYPAAPPAVPVGAVTESAGANSPSSEWRAWAAASVMAGAVVAFAWATRGPEWFWVRAVRRALRGLKFARAGDREFVVPQ
jgi:hypothetical protein